MITPKEESELDELSDKFREDEISIGYECNEVNVSINLKIDELADHIKMTIFYFYFARFA